MSNKNVIPLHGRHEPRPNVVRDMGELVTLYGGLVETFEAKGDDVQADDHGLIDTLHEKLVASQDGEDFEPLELSEEDMPVVVRSLYVAINKDPEDSMGATITAMNMLSRFEDGQSQKVG